MTLFPKRPRTGPVVTGHTCEEFIPYPFEYQAASLRQATLWISGHGPDLPALPTVVSYPHAPRVVELSWYLHDLDKGEQLVTADHVWRAVGPDADWSTYDSVAGTVTYWRTQHRRIQFCVSVTAGLKVSFGSPAAIPAVTP